MDLSDDTTLFSKLIGAITKGFYRMTQLPKGAWGGVLDPQFRERQQRQMQQIDMQHAAFQQARMAELQARTEKSTEAAIAERAAELRKKTELSEEEQTIVKAAEILSKPSTENVSPNEPFDLTPAKKADIEGAPEPKKPDIKIEESAKKPHVEFILGHAVLTMGMIEKEIDAVDNVQLLTDLMNAAMAIQTKAMRRLTNL